MPAQRPSSSCPPILSLERLDMWIAEAERAHDQAKAEYFRSVRKAMVSYREKKAKTDVEA